MSGFNAVSVTTGRCLGPRRFLTELKVGDTGLFWRRYGNKGTCWRRWHLRSRAEWMPYGYFYWLRVSRFKNLLFRRTKSIAPDIYNGFVRVKRWENGFINACYWIRRSNFQMLITPISDFLSLWGSCSTWRATRWTPSGHRCPVSSSV